MKRIPILPFTLVMLTALVGCSPSQSSEETISSPAATQDIEAARVAGSSTATASPSSAGSPVEGMDPSNVDEGKAQAIREYLIVRENRESAKYHDAAEYEEALGKVTTESGRGQVLQHFRVENRSAQRLIALEGNYVVDPQVGKCSTNPAYATGSQVAVMCPLSDLVTVEGKLYPLNEVSMDWIYFGANPPVTLILKQEDGRWLVEADYTGLAS